MSNILYRLQADNLPRAYRVSLAQSETIEIFKPEKLEQQNLILPNAIV